MTQTISHALTHFPPHRQAAQTRLDAFASRAGKAYAQMRNFDQGPGQHDNVSRLSPYLRLRVLDEVHVSRAVLAQQSQAGAEKFLTEVFWRTYWKGWLELRPGVWAQYLHDLKRLQDDVQTQGGLRRAWESACAGQTGIAPFDDWATELVETGYLHNHARMWFASIWIFTLDLPWQLGADFFMRHLLDGDVASNTLGWRWVAGIQTRGKTYLADPDNIATFTRGRYPKVEGLARFAVPRDAPENPPARPLPPCLPGPLSGRIGHLLHSDDVDAGLLSDLAATPVSTAYADGSAGVSPWQINPHVTAFRDAMVKDVLPESTGPLRDAQAIADWASAHRLDHIVAPYAPVGPVAAMFETYADLADAPPLHLVRRPLDTAAWPLATKGFFPFKKHIPDLIGRFVRS